MLPHELKVMEASGNLFMMGVSLAKEANKEDIPVLVDYEGGILRVTPKKV